MPVPEELIGSTDAISLRALQMLDEIANADWLAEHRHWLTAAQDELGERLGLECTGEVEMIDGRRSYNHGHLPYANHTCPIHEWLQVGDYNALKDRPDGHPMKL